jgi:hypothetical protein
VAGAGPVHELHGHLDLVAVALDASLHDAADPEDRDGAVDVDPLAPEGTHPVTRDHVQ